MKLFIGSAVSCGAVALVYNQFFQTDESNSIPNGIAEFHTAVAEREVHRRLKVRPVRFYAMGDAPYSPTEMENLPLQLSLLDPTADFTVHLGDMKARAPICKPDPYPEIAAVLKTSPTPTFIIPGDNCYYDCANWKEGFKWWSDALLRLNENWPITKFKVRRQPSRPENFSITWHRVLFIGVHTLWTSGKIKDQAHWNALENDNINWTRTQLKTFADKGLVDAVVIFGHAYPRPQMYPKFFDVLSDEAERMPTMPFLFLQGDTHRFAQDTPFRAKNILRTVVDRGGIADPVLVTVDTTQPNPFQFERRALSGM